MMASPGGETAKLHMPVHIYPIGQMSGEKIVLNLEHGV